MALVTICSEFEAPKNKVCHCFHCFTINLPWSDGNRCHDPSFLNIKFYWFIFLEFHFCFIDYAKALTEWITTNWKILKEMGIIDHLTCLLRNMYAGQEAIVRTELGIAAWYQIGKRVWQGCILSPCLFNLHTEYIMRNAGRDEAQARIKNARRNISNLR